MWKRLKNLERKQVEQKTKCQGESAVSGKESEEEEEEGKRCREEE